jgi:hypothetical protein
MEKNEENGGQKSILQRFTFEDEELDQAGLVLIKRHHELACNHQSFLFVSSPIELEGKNIGRFLFSVQPISEAEFQEVIAGK